MALSLAWGLMIAMPLTLFILPMAYVTVEDFRAAVRRGSVPFAARVGQAVKRVMGGGKPVPPKPGKFR
jgi:hypothetical protein